MQWNYKTEHLKTARNKWQHTKKILDEDAI